MSSWAGSAARAVAAEGRRMEEAMLDIGLPRLPRPQVQLCVEDYEQLLDIVSAIDPAPPGRVLLWREVMRASLIPQSQAPRDLVRLNSRVRYRDMIARESFEVVITHARARGAAGGVEVDSEIGAALIGLLPNDVFGWTGDLGRVRVIRVDEVVPADG